MEIIILASKHAGVLVKSTLELKIENFNEKIKKQKISSSCFIVFIEEIKLGIRDFRTHQGTAWISSGITSLYKQVLQ